MEEVKTESDIKNIESPAGGSDNSVEAIAPTEKVGITNLKELLSDDLKEHKALQNYDTVDSMAKSLLSAQELVGKRVADLSAEELIGLDAKFGKPENIEGYNFEADEAFKNTALDAGLSHNQALKLWEKQAETLSASEKAKEEALVNKMDEAGKALEAEFGSQLEARVNLAKKAAQELGGEDLYKGVFESEAGMDPTIIKALSEAGKRIFDHESVATEQITKFGLTPQEALNEIETLKRDPVFKELKDSRDARARNAAAEKLRKLFKVAYPEQK